ncbi:MAG TPA: hypothetical protein VEC35_01015 [Noviherbaspirillum sp.]|nr:hypothetical protein [Noviherbaspirillum sp.]
MRKDTEVREHKDKSDAELAADARMVVQELSALLTEFKHRGIEWDARAYASGRMEIDIYRNSREDL